MSRQALLVACLAVAVGGCSLFGPKTAPAAGTTGAAAAPGADPAAAREDVSASADATVETHPGADEEVVQLDINNDKKPDVYKFYPKGQVPKDDGSGGDAAPPLRKAVDLNGDGRIDLWTWFNRDASIQKQAFDLDFDGRIDELVYYEKGAVVRKELFHSFGDKPDTFKFYEKGKLVRVERDRSNDGRIDTWEYWEGEAIDRIGEDTNGDGNVDKWIKKRQAAQ